MARTEYFDALETRSFEEREIALATALEVQVAHAKANAPFFAEWLKDVDPATITSRAALARLPILRKADLSAVQKKIPPMGGLLSVPLAQVQHIFQGPFSRSILPRRTICAAHGPCMRQGFVPAISFTIPFRIISRRPAS